MKSLTLVLLLLLPLCSVQQHFIECYAEDFYMVRNQKLRCGGPEKQACYTRDTGEKGCTRLEFCSLDGWKCCYTNLCNA